VPASQELPAGTAPSVLLIEEYDALAAAITSALKKFAPQHRTLVVGSLGEAEAVLAQTQPQLLIIDFDPPHSNAIEFLNRIRPAHPDARVLAIASGISPEFTAQRYGPNAIQFVEKPFELADFGAAVQALLGPWTEAKSGDSRGTLRDLNLRDLVPLECVGGATAILTVEAGERTGEVHFFDGHICHAEIAGLYGIGALHEIMRWTNVRGIEADRPAHSPRTIQGPWLHVFLEALRKSKPSIDDPETHAPSIVLHEEPAPTPAKSGKKIVVIDDTEMLLIFVEDSLSIADPSLQIVTAFTGAEGVRRVEAMIPDLVLLDYSVPDLRGDQICERLLQNSATARIPVVMMSGHVPEMLATAERYPNVVATIAKPFMSEALVQLVNETLAKGPGPVAPPREKAAGWTAVDHSAGLTSPEPKPVRHGNGKKPVKKALLAKTENKDLPTTPSPSTPSSLLPPPPPPPEASVAVVEPVAPATAAPSPPVSIKVVEPIAKAAPAPTPAPPPATRDIRPTEPGLYELPPVPSARPASVAGPVGGGVVLGLGMEVISVQFTPRFQIGTIRARPAAPTLSLTPLLMPSEAQKLVGAGFELGPVDLSPDGRIRTLRVRPTRRPAESVRTQAGFDINDVNLVNEPACIQFTAGMSAPMTMQLVAIFKIAGVELSDRFEVDQLVLQAEGHRVRVTLEPQSGGMAGTEFETIGVRLDASGRIVEFLLSSLQSDQPERRVHVA
jgi:DNA-binding response OmpR family regulator